MAQNRGKAFEDRIRRAFEDVPGVSIDRIHDQTTGYRGSQNICDFIVYKKPYEFYIECKSAHGKRLPFSNITDKQWSGLLEKSYINGVKAGIICWWVDYNITAYIPIQILEIYKQAGKKSLPYWDEQLNIIRGQKQRVFYKYDMTSFFKEFRV